MRDGEALRANHEFVLHIRLSLERAPLAIGADGFRVHCRAESLAGLRRGLIDLDRGARERQVGRIRAEEPGDTAVEDHVRFGRDLAACWRLSGDEAVGIDEGDRVVGHLAVIEPREHHVFGASQCRPIVADVGRHFRLPDPATVGLRVFVIGVGAQRHESDAGRDFQPLRALR